MAVELVSWYAPSTMAEFSARSYPAYGFQGITGLPESAGRLIQPVIPVLERPSHFAWNTVRTGH